MIIISEIEIWERMIKWELAQNLKLPSDLVNFSKDDFNTLKNTLQKFIPFIKFHNLTFKEFLKKVESNNIDSKIITIQHAELISIWIDKLEIIDKLTTSYEFKLLYRDSRDGSGGMYHRFNKFREIYKG
ncbi:hypothetical protein C1646_752067 [Rhizophagus diaphanus]|nr:hypothetical protein C1646_752067 [Rhizophagus diaphanus] [Rhizophagus sp. MUCL 43196]